MSDAMPIDIARLSPQERLALIGELWDSLADSDIPLTPAQEAERDRRLANRDDNRDGLTWQQLKGELN